MAGLWGDVHGSYHHHRGPDQLLETMLVSKGHAAARVILISVMLPQGSCDVWAQAAAEGRVCVPTRLGSMLMSMSQGIIGTMNVEV